MFKRGKKDGKSISIKERAYILGKIRKEAKGFEDVKNIIFEFMKEKPQFRSFIDEANYIAGFLIGLSYITKGDINKEINEIMRKLNILDVKELIDSYYILLGKYIDKRYNKIRYKVYLMPKKGTLVKPTSRIPKEKDPKVIESLIQDLREYLQLYSKIDKRKISFFNKIV